MNMRKVVVDLGMKGTGVVSAGKLEFVMRRGVIRGYGIVPLLVLSQLIERVKQLGMETSRYVTVYDGDDIYQVDKYTLEVLLVGEEVAERTRLLLKLFDLELGIYALRIRFKDV